MKYKDWKKDREILEKEYIHKQFCEYCGSTFGLSFHHLKRRSKGGDNSLENIMLLCAECHHRADNAPNYVEFNENLKRIKQGK